VIVMSRWGNKTTNNGAPMQGTTQSNDQLFDAVDALGGVVVIMPAIDTFTADGYRDFRTDFPGTPDRPAPQLLAEVTDIVARYLQNPRWRQRFAQMYDRTGTARYAVNWIHAASTRNHNGCEFARGLDWIADSIARTHHVLIGFTLDTFNAWEGDKVPRFNCDVGYCPSPYNSCLAESKSLLGIQGFDPEVVRPGDIAPYPPGTPDPWVGVWQTPPKDANERMGQLIAWKRIWIKDWLHTGIPVIYDVSPGYDGRYVFADKGGVIYGDNAINSIDAWRNAQSELKGIGMKGTVYNAWNGYTEGLVATPGVWVNPQNVRSLDGRPPDMLKNWLTDYFSVDPRICNHVHYVNLGREKHVVVGAICEKFRDMGGDRSPLGEPVSGELPGCDGAKRTLFQAGSIVLSGQGTFEVHGRIGEKYQVMNYECGGLGPPTSDEQKSSCSDRLLNLFQGGAIIFSPGASAAFETHGAIAARYAALNRECGPLGAPVSDESDSPGNVGNKISYFQNGAILFTNSSGAVGAVYGAIGDLYRGMGYDRSWLGAPTSDGKACRRECLDGRTNDFQNGHITWCPTWPAARAIRGPSGC